MIPIATINTIDIMITVVDNSLIILCFPAFLSTSMSEKSLIT